MDGLHIDPDTLDVENCCSGAGGRGASLTSAKTCEQEASWLHFQKELFLLSFSSFFKTVLLFCAEPAAFSAEQSDESPFFTSV